MERDNGEKVGNNYLSNEGNAKSKYKRNVSPRDQGNYKIHRFSTSFQSADVVIYSPRYGQGHIEIDVNKTTLSQYYA